MQTSSNTSNGAPHQAITVDHISMKILSELYLGIRKFILHFGSHLLSAKFDEQSRV